MASRKETQRRRGRPLSKKRKELTPSMQSFVTVIPKERSSKQTVHAYQVFLKKTIFKFLEKKTN